MTLEKLKEKLEKAGINTQKWGKNGTKTVQHLLDEIINRETKLTTNTERNLVRFIRVVAINVYYHVDDKYAWKLVEEKQQFTDGTTKCRNIDTSLGEKIRENENPNESAIRALKEELGFEMPYVLNPLGVILRKKDSEFFPGLLSAYETYFFSCSIPQRLFKAKGYVEKKAEKRIFFIWRAI
ncbi:MAG: hypothetical protein AAB866_00920 [Patescibacteria group bacterium]|mgnify:CR=1 FL=1